MSATLAVALCVDIVALVVSQIDAGDQPALIEVYEGPQPQNPDADALDVPLVVWSLPVPAFAPPEPGFNGATALANEIAPVPASESGTAAYFRIVTRDGLNLLDGSVSTTTGNGMLKLDSVTVVKDVNVVVDSLTISQRAY